MNKLLIGLCKIHFVGQGNWNEILLESNEERFEITYDHGFTIQRFEDDKKIIYDFNRAKKFSLFKEHPASKTKECTRILIISHWDLDHYQNLINMSNNEILSFDYIYFPKNARGKSAELIAERIKKINKGTFEVTQDFNHKGRSKLVKVKELLPLSFEKKFKVNISLFKTTFIKDKNNGGLILILYKENDIVIFPADHHYRMYFNTNYLFNNSGETICVVPHHGGFAGTYSKSIRNAIQLKPVKWLLSSGLDDGELLDISPTANYENEIFTLRGHHPSKKTTVLLKSVNINVIKRTLDIKNNTYFNMTKNLIIDLTENPLKIIEQSIK